MAELLKVAQLADEHGVAEVQVGRGGVEAGLDAQRTPELEPLEQSAERCRSWGIERRNAGRLLQRD